MTLRYIIVCSLVCIASSACSGKGGKEAYDEFFKADMRSTMWRYEPQMIDRLASLEKEGIKVIEDSPGAADRSVLPGLKVSATLRLYDLAMNLYAEEEFEFYAPRMPSGVWRGLYGIGEGGRRRFVVPPDQLCGQYGGCYINKGRHESLIYLQAQTTYHFDVEIHGVCKPKFVGSCGLGGGIVSDSCELIETSCR